MTDEVTNSQDPGGDRKAGHGALPLSNHNAHLDSYLENHLPDRSGHRSSQSFANPGRDHPVPATDSRQDQIRNLFYPGLCDPTPGLQGL